MNRKDQFLPRGDAFWVGGSDRVEVWLSSPTPLTSAAIRVRDLASGNRVSVDLAGEEQVLDFAQCRPVAKAGSSASVHRRRPAPRRAAV